MVAGSSCVERRDVAGVDVAPPVAVRVGQDGRPSGPVPDYEQVDFVVTHARLDDMAPQLRPLLAKVLGKRHHIDTRRAPDWESPDSDVSDDDRSLVWMRDYQPIFVRNRTGGLDAVLYLSRNPNRSEWRGLLNGRSIRTRTLPLLHENGNMVVAGRRVIFTDLLFDENAEQVDDARLKRRGFEPRGAGDVLRLLIDALDRRIEDFVVLPQMPHEDTGHVDVFVLPLDADTVAVPSIPANAAQDSSAEPAAKIEREVRAFLDDVAGKLASAGLTVVRLPMLAPATALNHDDPTGEWVATLVFTPANSLLIDDGKQKLAFYPSFVSLVDDPTLIARITGFERTWERVFRRYGFEPHRVDASKLVGYLGLLRCVTAAVPR